ncbi:MAG: hypothetical protein R1F54_04545 [Candidatus Zeuxoniibacter abyssi]|nr:MAG: hypothetical protein R1F54_04545 [Candidatus Persebacteraceae bacterium AB1(2)]
MLFVLTANAVAELPPEIQGDRYLIEAQRYIKDDNYKAAKEAMDKIIALQKAHDLELPEDFYFKYAQILHSADFFKKAAEAVNRYLETVGRAGENYKEALELLVEIETRFVPDRKCKEIYSKYPEGVYPEGVYNDCWLEASNRSGCWLLAVIGYYSAGTHGETVTWSGGCKGGLAQGLGSMAFTSSEDTDRFVNTR